MLAKYIYPFSKLFHGTKKESSTICLWLYLWLTVNNCLKRFISEKAIPRSQSTMGAFISLNSELVLTSPCSQALPILRKKSLVTRLVLNNFIKITSCAVGVACFMYRPIGGTYPKMGSRNSFRNGIARCRCHVFKTAVFYFVNLSCTT